MSVAFWLARPRLLYHRTRYWFWERRNPDRPWLCPGTVDFCERHLRPDMLGLEFGSGRSTRWFAGKLRHLTSVEHDAAWAARVRQTLCAADIENVDYRHVPLDHPVEEGELPAYNPTPAYVAVADSFADRVLHLVVVDGHYRTHCVRRSVPKIAAGGYLLVDDVNLWPSINSLPVPADWRIVDDSTNGIKRCVIWRAA
jgi:hypothetical protein